MPVKYSMYWLNTASSSDLTLQDTTQLACNKPSLCAIVTTAARLHHRAALFNLQAYNAGDGLMTARLRWLLTVVGHPSALPTCSTAHVCCTVFLAGIRCR
jgi:hypothetical protein